ATGSALSPGCILRPIVCDISSAEDHSLANAALASAIPCMSRKFGCMAAGAAWAVAALAMRSAVSRNISWDWAGNPAPPHSFASACRYSSGSTSEHHDLAHRRALVQTIEPEIDLVEPQPSAHQAIDRQLAATIELDVARQIARRHAGADVAALYG